MKTKRKRAAVIRAPRDAGDNIPSIANTETAVTATVTHTVINNG